MQIGIYRKLFNRFKTIGTPADSPAIYLCRHMDMSGVIHSLVSLPVVVRPWTLYLFTEYQLAKKQFKEYTFSVRMKKSKLTTAIISPLSAWWLTTMIHSCEGIPVYRGEAAAKAYLTMKRSLDALLNGDNILIFPDVAYDDTGNETANREMYEGFVFLEKLYHKKTGRHIPFVPLCLDLKGKKLKIKKPVQFENGDFKAQLPRVMQQLEDGIYEFNKD